MAQVKKDLTMALKLALAEQMGEEEFWGSVDLNEEKPVMLPVLPEPVKIQEEPSVQEEKVVIKKNWFNTLVIPVLVIVVGGILLMITGSFTTKTKTEMLVIEQKLSGEMTRVEQKLDDFIIREQDHFDILLDEIRILRIE